MLLIRANARQKQHNTASPLSLPPLVFGGGRVERSSSSGRPKEIEEAAEKESPPHVRYTQCEMQ